MNPWHLAVLAISILALLLGYYFLREGVQYRRASAGQSRETQDFLSRATRAPALVVDVEERTENLNLGRYYRDYRDFCPVVEFRTWHGQPIRSRVEIGVERNPPQIGQQVEVCYDTAAPQRVRLNGPGLYPPRIARRGASGCMSIVYGVTCLLTGVGGTIGSIVAFFV